MKATLSAFGFEPQVYRSLSEHRNGSAILRALAAWARNEADAFDVAEALYFIAHDYGEGQDCPLRAAANATELEPGIGMLSRNAPEPDSIAAMVYSELESIIA